MAFKVSKIRKKFFHASGLVVVVVLFAVLVGRSLENRGAIPDQDKNNNEIWDDLEPAIQNFSNSEPERRALEGFVREFQIVLKNPEIGTRVRNAKREELPQLDRFWKSSACVFEVFLKSRGTIFEVEQFEEQLLSTSARIRAYARYNGNLSGGVYPSWDQEKHGPACDFTH